MDVTLSQAIKSLESSLPYKYKDTPADKLKGNKLSALLLLACTSYKVENTKWY